MSARHSLLRTLAATAVLLGGCTSTAGPVLPLPDHEPLTFTLLPSDATIEEGQTLDLTVTVTDADGNRLALTGIQWSSSNENVAGLIGAGKVQGRHAGTAVIVAAWEGSSDQALVHVRSRSPCPPLVRASQTAVPCPTP